MRRLLIVLLFALPTAILARTYGLRGTVLTPDRILQNSIVIVDGDTIEAVTDHAPSGVSVIETNGVILPGLIDLHNHLTWNAFKRWTPATPVKNRYDWLVDPAYLAALSDPHKDIQATNACDLERYAEFKALIGGATTTNGSYGPTNNTCVRGLARNLDVASDLFGPTVNMEPLQYRVFPLELKPDDEAKMRTGINEHKPIIVHLAEGIDGSAQHEFIAFQNRQFLAPGVVIIHGIALTPKNFADMHTAGVGLVWSPRSNIELYGRTTDIRAAKAAGVTIAISPDWSPSGSNGMLDELRYALTWSSAQDDPPLTAKELVTYATSNAAQLGGVSDFIGTIAPRKKADLLVVTNATASDPYEAVVNARPNQVGLVIIGGRPVYGSESLVRAIDASAVVEKTTICGATKVLDPRDSDNGEGITLATTLNHLQDAFGKHQPPLSVAPLVTCH